MSKEMTFIQRWDREVGEKARGSFRKEVDFPGVRRAGKGARV